MKRTFKAAILLILALLILLTPIASQAKIPATRTFTGTYYDYMCIVTKSGKEILLPDTQAATSNKYMKWNKNKKCYIPIFRDGQKVKITLKAGLHGKYRVLKAVKVNI